MTMYATYEYYIESFGGKKLSVKEFARLAKRASGYLDALCCYRIPKDEPPEEVKDACCALCDIYADESRRAHIISENTDGYVVTYREESTEKKAYKTACDYIYPTGLLYAGFEVI